MNNQQKTITEETAKRLSETLQLAKKPVYNIRNSQIAAGVTGSIGLIIFALGVENLMTNVLKISSPYVEIMLGLILLSISGLFLKKLL